MRITNPTNQTPINSVDNSTTPAVRPDSTASGVPASTDLSARAASADAYGLVPSFELLSLNALLQQVPPVRADVIAETVQRLASGQLRTADTINRTADALLGA
ncbi:MAG TPA: hypothetical protein VN688_13165 [Gemmataceae bacterium]|nr:hypothetical protein [Gemmataceae bacterium]